jgi:hypothetical protein
MSEQALKFETNRVPEQNEHSEAENLATKRPESAPEASPAEQLEQARQTVEQVAETAPKVQYTAQEKAPTQPTQVSKELRTLTAARGLSRIRHQLPLPQKVLSRVIHQPAIRIVSDFGAKTVGRPAALLTGGFCAFIGTSAYLFLARYIGFSFNYLICTLLFVAGLVLGFGLELVGSLFRRSKNRF